MKIYTSNYRDHWLSPYTILEKFFFWRKDYDAFKNEPPKWLQTLCECNKKFLDTVHPRINYIKIDPSDTWNMDYALSPIILPMLKQLQKSKQGAPWVDDEDVPDYLKSMNAPRVEYAGETDDNFFLRWDWVLNEEIFAFESKNNDEWMEQFKSGVSDITWVDSDEEYDGEKCTVMKQGPNHTLVYDWDGINAYEARIQNGFRLFGKYYSGHWD